MKQILLLLSACFISLLASAQTEETSKFINGAFRISVISSGENIHTGFQIAPGFGYFIKDNIALGGSLGVVKTFSGGAGDGLTSVHFTPFIRRYWPIVENKFFFSISGQLNLFWGQTASAGNIDFTSTDNVFSTGIVLSPGFTYFPSPQWALDFNFNGLSLLFFGIGEGGSTGFSLGTETFSPTIGMSYYF